MVVCGLGVRDNPYPEHKGRAGRDGLGHPHVHEATRLASDLRVAQDRVREEDEEEHRAERHNLLELGRRRKTRAELGERATLGFRALV